MGKRKKKCGIYDTIGREKFDFDFLLEKNIYYYLCHEKIKGKNIVEFNENVKFNTYAKWKNYISSKYSKYSIDQLIELKKYLNQRKRIRQPEIEYRRITTSVLLAFAISTTANIMFDEIYENINMIGLLLFTICNIILLAGVIFVIMLTFNCMYKNDVINNMYTDYIEIINEIIKFKKQNKK